MSTKPWKTAASLIIVAKKVLQHNLQSHVSKNYDVLTLKRSSKASFMPNSYVFPGGIAEKTDSQKDWINLYIKFGVTKEELNEISNFSNMPVIYDHSESEISRSISLRITAIRETFEECGILLCRNRGWKQETEHSACIFERFVDLADKMEWQRKVYNNSDEFIKLCYKYEIYPDIFALKEWSNWLTPSHFKKRFDTMFYIAMLDKVPKAAIDAKEIQSTLWGSPCEYLELNNNKKLILPPPQVYELSRLYKYDDVQELIKFAHMRRVNGLERFLPYTIKTSMGNMQLLPGDDMYPGEKIVEERKFTIMDSVPVCNVMHRIYHGHLHHSQVMTRNLVPRFKHCIPVNSKDVTVISQKL